VALPLGAQPGLAAQPAATWVAVVQEMPVARSLPMPRAPAAQLCAAAPGGAPAGSVLDVVDVPSSEDPQPAPRRATATSARASAAAPVGLFASLSSAALG
jgi:hypothetical protein